MSSLRPFSVLATGFSAFAIGWLSLEAQVTPPSCGSDGVGKRAIVVDAQDITNQKTCVSNGKQRMPPFEITNRRAIDVVLYNIDPFLQTCTVTTKSTAVVENSSGVASTLGITVPAPASAAPAGNTPAVKSKVAEANATAAHAVQAAQSARNEALKPRALASAKAVAAQAEEAQKAAEAEANCTHAFDEQHESVILLSQTLQAFQGLAGLKVKAAQDNVNAYNMLVDQAESYSPKDWSAIQQSAKGLSLIDTAEPTITAADLSGLPAEVANQLNVYTGKTYSTVVTGLAQEADSLRQSLQVGDACSSDTTLKNEFTKDQQFLRSVYTDMNGSPSVESTIKAQMESIATMASTLSQAKSAMLVALGKPGATRIVHTIDGSDTDQNQVAVTITCATHGLGLQRIDVQQQSPGNSAKPAAPAAAAKAASAAAPAGTPGSNSQTASFNIQFGEGPRVAITGGFAVAPLVTHIYSTTASTNTTKSGSSSTSTIVDSSNSSTRIAPLGMVAVRMADLENEFHQKQLSYLIPNYLTLGITAQGDSNKGATIAYLMGSSIASPGKNLFLTVGAFAATVEHLENGLAVGSTTTLSAANLPITQQYHWKLGFALSYKIK
jgi:hypothetical protein